MTRAKPKDLGTLIDVPEGAEVVRPDGETVTVTGGTYVLNQAGDYTVDGKSVPVGGDDDTDDNTNQEVSS